VVFDEVKYAGLYTLSNLFYYDVMPRQHILPENVQSYEVDQLQQKIRTFNMVYPFDSMVPYTSSGTEAEFLNNDGYTLIEETVTKIILGQQSIDTWDAAVAQYNQLEGDVRSKVWTEQYNAYLGGN
jgi:hypothetical protein